MNIQIDDKIVEASQEQIAIIEELRAQPKINDQIAEQELLKQSARNKLIDLGLTEDEAKAFLG